MFKMINSSTRSQKEKVLQARVRSLWLPVWQRPDQDLRRHGRPAQVAHGKNRASRRLSSTCRQPPRRSGPSTAVSTACFWQPPFPPFPPSSAGCEPEQPRDRDQGQRRGAHDRGAQGHDRLGERAVRQARFQQRHALRHQLSISSPTPRFQSPQDFRFSNNLNHSVVLLPEQHLSCANLQERLLDQNYKSNLSVVLIYKSNFSIKTTRATSRAKLQEQHLRCPRVPKSSKVQKCKRATHTSNHLTRTCKSLYLTTRMYSA